MQKQTEKRKERKRTSCAPFNNVNTVGLVSFVKERRIQTDRDTDRERHSEAETDRQTDRQNDRMTDRHRQTER